MVKTVQRILQILVFGGLVFLIIKPEIAPAPVRPFTKGLSQAVIGETPTWAAFRKTWSERWAALTQLLPQLKKLAVSPPPETITADYVLGLMQITFIKEPLNKLNRVKESLWVTPTPIPTASPAGEIKDELQEN